AEAGVLNLSEIDGKWECYITKLADNVLYIAGSDKRGCIYGIYRLSELIGVSPWVWFADVTPEKKEELKFTAEELDCVSKEPSVKYRGIFINDESPSFTGWVYGKFGGLNDKMYNHVFELILRLKGNYLWPAMWGNIFSEEGSEHPHDNIRVADEYGVVMGTSHHEPMCRAGEEWRHLWQQYTDKYNWDFAVNREGISKFWEDGIKRNKPYESVITVGMRGEADSELAGSMQYNIDLLKDIILTQKSQLAAEGLENAPKMLVVYKEVEKYWNGNEECEGLKNWKDENGNSPLDDVVIMLCEDNFGNVRSLPVTDKLKNRKGGWGMYYHFDYNGAPRGYMWLNVMQLEKTWEQLSETYECGVRDIWIVNVGDLKPMEMQISYYMDLAYDFEKYGTNGSVTPGDYYLQFVKQQFSHGVSEVIQAQMAGLLAGYSKLNGICKPEYMRENIYSLENFGEAQSMLDFALFLMEGAELCKQEIPADLQDAYEQLVYYPVTASANVVALYIYSAYNRYYAEKKDVRTNGFAALVEEAIEKDKELMRHYNEEMSGGKWNKMMSQTHLGYVAWNAENAAPPTPVVLEGVDCPFNKDVLIEELMEAEFIRPDGYVVLQADSFKENVPVALRETVGEQEKIFAAQFRVIPNYGRSDAAVKVFPITMETGKQFDATGSVANLPYLEYEFEVSEDAEYTIRTYLAPSNNLDGDKVELRYALQADGAEPMVVNALPKGYIAGDYWEPQWCRAVEINAHINESKITLAADTHKLRFYGIDAGVVLQKIVIYRGELPQSYLGPEE
ncbi:MAG: glycosyl hydrolase 115 family protein, partial [Lachnospiraceae bacterium]|nr:glycosyl hydrolase 115 family protein [Lachnospiraceae bacterium]